MQASCMAMALMQQKLSWQEAQLRCCSLQAGRGRPRCGRAACLLVRHEDLLGALLQGALRDCGHPQLRILICILISEVREAEGPLAGVPSIAVPCGAAPCMSLGQSVDVHKQMQAICRLRSSALHGTFPAPLQGDLVAGDELAFPVVHKGFPGDACDARCLQQEAILLADREVTCE